MNRRNRLSVFPLAGILLLGFALGALKLNADILWLDELYSLSNMGVFEAPFNPADVMDSLAEHSPNHVPLYFVLGARWASLVGWAPLPMRYLSLLFGLLLIAWQYRFAADALDRQAGFLSALLLSSSGFVLLYFHEVRMYALLLLLMLMQAWLYWRLTSRNAVTLRVWLAFIATAAALLYTHVFSAFFLVGLGLHHLIFASSLKRWRGVAFAWCLSALAFLPYLPYFLRGALAERTIATLQATALGAPEIAIHLARIAVNGVEILWLPMLALALLALRNRRLSRIAPILVIWAGIVASLLLFNEIFPLIDRLRFRFFLASMPFFVMICAWLILSSARWRLVALPFVLLWMAGGFSIYGLGDSWRYAGRNEIFADIPPLNQYTQALRGKTRALDTIVSHSRSKWVDWKLRHGRSIADYYFGALLKLDHAFAIAPSSQSDSPLDLGKLLDDHPYLLLTYDPAEESPRFDQVAASIRAEYAECEVLVEEETLVVKRFVHPGSACDREYAPIHYENGIRIIDRFGFYDSQRSRLRVVTGWEVADEAQLEAYNLSIQILASDGAKVGQAGDRHLYDDILKWNAVEMSALELPPGEYRAVVIVYDRYSGDKVTGVDMQTGEVGVILPLLRFTIEAPPAQSG